MDYVENFIRHHKDKRQYLHEMQRSETTPIPKDQLLDERETHIEYQKSKKKVRSQGQLANREEEIFSQDGGILKGQKRSTRSRKIT